MLSILSTSISSGRHFPKLSSFPLVGVCGDSGTGVIHPFLLTVLCLPERMFIFAFTQCIKGSFLHKILGILPVGNLSSPNTLQQASRPLFKKLNAPRTKQTTPRQWIHAKPRRCVTQLDVSGTTQAFHEMGGGIGCHVGEIYWIPGGRDSSYYGIILLLNIFTHTANWFLV